MNFRKLGNTDIDVSTICLGTMTWGEQNSQEDAFKQMDYALDKNVNFWDTAEIYSVPPREETFGSTEKIIGELQRRTSLQSNFGAILLALVDGQPKQLSLRLLLEKFIEYRELTIIKRTKYLLIKTLERLEIVQSLIKALANLKQVIAMIEKAKDALEAKERLMKSLKVNEKHDVTPTSGRRKPVRQHVPI